MAINNSVPYEVIAAPYTVYWAQLNPTWPAVNAAPSSTWWTVFGTSGNLNITEAGVTVSHPQETTEWRALGDIGTRKVFRTKEDLMVRFVLADLTLEQYRHALNSNPLTTVAAGSGTAGYKKIGLSRGAFVSQVALLIRGVSPHLADGTSQYEIPIAFASGSPEVTFANSGEPAGLAFEFKAAIDTNAGSEDERYGRLIVMTAQPL
jgi:hypothetical protein